MFGRVASRLSQRLFSIDAVGKVLGLGLATAAAAHALNACSEESETTPDPQIRDSSTQDTFETTVKTRPSMTTNFGKVQLQPAKNAMALAVKCSQEEPKLGRRSEMAKRSGIQFLRHKTDCANIPAILESGTIKPGVRLKKNNYGYRETEYKSSVYLEMTHEKSEAGILEPALCKSCTLYLSTGILDQNNYHLSRGWLYGKKHEGVSAESSEHGKMEKVIHSITEDRDYVVQNEVVVRETVDLAHYLQAAALPQTPS